MVLLKPFFGTQGKRPVAYVPHTTKGLSPFARLLVGRIETILVCLALHALSYTVHSGKKAAYPRG